MTLNAAPTLDLELKPNGAIVPPKCRKTVPLTSEQQQQADAAVAQIQQALDHQHAERKRTQEEEFDWGPDNGDIVCHEQRRTAIYTNQFDYIVIRQCADWNEQDDPFLVFDPLRIPDLIAALQAEYDGLMRSTRGNGKGA